MWLRRKFYSAVAVIGGDGFSKDNFFEMLLDVCAWFQGAVLYDSALNMGVDEIQRLAKFADEQNKKIESRVKSK